MKILALILLSISTYAQDSIVYYHADTVLSRVIIEGNIWRYNNVDCEKIGNVWNYYRSDTLYQKLEFYDNGHKTFYYNGAGWSDGIECVIYDTPTNYNIELKSSVVLYSNSLVVHIRSDKPIQRIKVYDLEGKLLKELQPFDTYIRITFNYSEMLIFDIDKTIYKHLIK